VGIGNYYVDLYVNDLGNIIIQISKSGELIFQSSYYLFKEIFMVFKDKLKSLLQEPEMLAFFKKHNSSLFPDSPDHELQEDKFIAKLLDLE
jgi:hypothetical protein